MCCVRLSDLYGAQAQQEQLYAVGVQRSTFVSWTVPWDCDEHYRNFRVSISFCTRVPVIFKALSLLRSHCIVQKPRESGLKKHRSDCRTNYICPFSRSPEATHKRSPNFYPGRPLSAALKVKHPTLAGKRGFVGIGEGGPTE